MKLFFNFIIQIKKIIIYLNINKYKIKSKKINFSPQEIIFQKRIYFPKKR